MNERLFPGKSSYTLSIKNTCAIDVDGCPVTYGVRDIRRVWTLLRKRRRGLSQGYDIVSRHYLCQDMNSGRNRDTCSRANGVPLRGEGPSHHWSELHNRAECICGPIYCHRRPMSVTLDGNRGLDRDRRHSRQYREEDRPEYDRPSLPHRQRKRAYLERRTADCW